MAAPQLDLDQPTLLRALGGEPVAARRMVQVLTPVIQARAARQLLRRQRGAGGRDVAQEIADLTQRVFLIMLEDDGRVLRQWDPARGLSLLNFVGLVAEREVASILRSGRRSPWTDDPTLDEDLAAHAEPVRASESQLLSQEMLELLLDKLRARLSPNGLALFHRLFVDEATVEEVCAEQNMTAAAVYAWRSRLGKLIREISFELMSDSERKARIPEVRP
jgi:RNA polymerase sigma-70 factor (ECF subfamily)